MSSDYHYQTIARWDGNLPIDEWGHYLNWGDVRCERNEARDLTCPYGALEWAVGSGDDFHCFDYATLPDGRVALHAVINSETGCFIQDAGYEVVPPEAAVDVASGFIDMAIDWLYQGGSPPIRHTTRGWNQDPYYFVRCVARCVSDPRIAWWRGGRIVRGAKMHNWLM